MSPYLFVIMSELLLRILYKAEANDFIHGVKVARLAPLITHLAFCR